jgi:hypothetical protein
MSSLRKALQKVKSKSQLLPDKNELKLTENKIIDEKLFSIPEKRAHPFLEDVVPGTLTTVTTVHLQDGLVSQWVADMNKKNDRGSRILPTSMALEYMISVALEVNSSSPFKSDNQIVSITDLNMVNRLEADDASLFPRNKPTSMLCLVGSDESLGLYGQKSCGKKMVFADANVRVKQAVHDGALRSVLGNSEIHVNRFVSLTLFIGFL